MQGLVREPNERLDRVVSQAKTGNVEKFSSALRVFLFDLGEDLPLPRVQEALFRLLGSQAGERGWGAAAKVSLYGYPFERLFAELCHLSVDLSKSPLLRGVWATSLRAFSTSAESPARPTRRLGAAPQELPRIQKHRPSGPISELRLRKYKIHFDFPRGNFRWSEICFLSEEFEISFFRTHEVFTDLTFHFRAATKIEPPLQIRTFTLPKTNSIFRMFFHLNCVALYHLFMLGNSSSSGRR